MSQYDKIAKHYINRRFDKGSFDFNRDIEVPAMIKMIGEVSNKTVLDMGCGFANHCQILSESNPRKMIGFDISMKLVKYANSQRIPKCEFEFGDMNKKLKYQKNSFDIIFSSLALHYVKNLDLLFSEVKRILKPKGLFIFSIVHPIRSVLKRSPHLRISIKKIGKKRIFEGDYFDESERCVEVAELGQIKSFNHTLETWIKTSLKYFELVDYEDAKPLISAKKLDLDKYNLTTALPTFIIFKWVKRHSLL